MAKKAEFTENFKIRRLLFHERLGNATANIQSSNVQFLDSVAAQPLLKRVQQTAVEDTTTQLVDTDTTNDEDVNVVTWTDGSPPSWFELTKQKYLHLRMDRETDETVTMNSLYWHIIDLSDFKELKAYLSPAEIKDVTDIFSESLASFTKPENVKAQISSAQMIEVCQALIVKGLVGGLRQLAEALLLLETHPVQADELKALLDDEHPTEDKVSVLADKVGGLVSEYDKTNTFDEDVKYIFNLLQKTFEMIEDGVPSRQNTERDLDANIYWEMFACLKRIAGVHFGEVVSRSSRFRRCLSSQHSEGYHLDYIFTALQARAGYNAEFALSENVGASVKRFKNDSFLQQ
ncbi:hypothetical protein HDU78_004305 [Chytriomyces hyalinus]|nr:hypothetical protein HDU78_004305 [Chytriomyces hyalinus]